MFVFDAFALDLLYFKKNSYFCVDKCMNLSLSTCVLLDAHDQLYITSNVLCNGSKSRRKQVSRVLLGTVLTCPLQSKYSTCSRSARGPHRPISISRVKKKEKKSEAKGMFFFQGLFLGHRDAHQVVKVCFCHDVSPLVRSDRTSSWKKE